MDSENVHESLLEEQSMERIEAFEAKLLMLLELHAQEMPFDELLFAFARSALRTALTMVPEELPPDRTHRLVVTALSNCGCLLDVRMGDCLRPENYADETDHSHLN